MTNQTQKYTFYIHGMHCNACVILTESEIAGLPNVTKVRSSLASHTVEVEGDFGDKSLEEIAAELSLPLKSHGYTVSTEKQERTTRWADFKIALPIALGFLVLFIFLQKIRMVSLVNVGSLTYGSVFLIGVIASLSSCMAVVGSLVLSMSATFAKDGDKIKPQFLFHFGRIVSFFFLGGVIGAVGSRFTLTSGSMFVLGLIIGMVMLVLGLNLLDVFHWTKKLQPAMPKFISKHAYGLSKLNHSVVPFLVGVTTFFLPCGFTQSMQIYTLSTGSFIKGGLTMLAFALGTLPVLALVGFSSFSIRDSKSGIFFKTAGLIVIAFALFDIINSFVAAGFIPPIFNF
jgi:sulfite exporter TauE/SafE/copper chaperone CopZ